MSVFIVSGLLSSMWQMHQHMLLFTNKDLAMAEEYRPALPAEALVLSSTGVNNPIWSLAGQTVVEGRFDYLWDYGLPAQEVQDDINSIFQGNPSATRLLQHYRIQYVLISPFERSQIRGLNEVYFLQRFPMIFHKGGVEIFKIRQ